MNVSISPSHVLLVMGITFMAPSITGLFFSFLSVIARSVVITFRNESIPTDGSARLLVTDTHTDVNINVNSVTNTISYNPEDAVIVCRSTKNVAKLRSRRHTSYWYLDPEVKPTARTGFIINNNAGWARVTGRTHIENGNYHRAALLKRETDNAVEGKFTCHIENDSDNDKYLLILYPILSVSVSVAVDSESPYLYRIECISTGGRVLNMSITGPDGEVFPLNNIQPVGTQNWMGNDSYSGVWLVDHIDDRDTYVCDASNGVSFANDSTIITVTKKPTNMSLKRITTNEVRIEWNHPSGRTTATNYIVFYNSGNIYKNLTVPMTKTSTVISVFPLKYSVSVMAFFNQTQGFSGRTQWATIRIRSPENVWYNDLENGSVRVYWEAVEGADNYTILFSQTMGDEQKGRCKNESHFARNSVTVNSLDSGSASGMLNNTSNSNSIIINVGGNVDFNDATTLRAFTTYSVTVIPFSKVWGESVGSIPMKITTPQREPAIAPTNVFLINATSTTIHVEWEWDSLSPCWLLNGPITGFMIQYHVENDSDILYTSSSDTKHLLSGLNPSTNYTIRVAAVNNDRIGPYCDHIVITTENYQTPISNNTKNDSHSEGNGNHQKNQESWKYVWVFVGPITVLIVLLVSILLAVILTRKYRQKQLPIPSFDPPVVNTLDVKPKIVKFPSEFVRVNEGERVVFDITVEGNPRPQLTWYYNDCEVVGTYSIDVGLDGSLTIPCSEPSHTGVYQLLAVNSVGQTDREVELFVRKEKQAILINVERNTSICPIPVTEFVEYVANCHSKGDDQLKEQFSIIDVVSELPITAGTNSDTVLLNRFANITVYNNNRIVLVPIEGHLNCQRDFINACYIDGYKCKKKFIATQGPLPETVVDFWRLVWQERPPTIVMLTDLKEGKKVKCHKYWPDSGTQLFGPFRVTITDQKRFTDYTSRCLFVELDGGGSQSLKVTQLQYTAWTTGGVPCEANSFLAFHRRVKKQHKFPKRPILVHCSGGVGRTGTLITIDRVLDHMLDERIVDIAGTIKLLQNQRMKMVQLQGQYIFIHDVIVEELMCGDTQIDVFDLKATMLDLNRLDELTNTTGYEKQFMALGQLKSHETPEKSIKFSRKKKRDSIFHQSLDGCATELENKVNYVHGYNQKEEFIIAENPTQSTTGDFWRMVYDTKCGVIINLNNSEETEKGVCCKYWPDSEVMNIGGYLINSLHIEELTGFTIRSFIITLEKSGKRHSVCQIHVTCWDSDGKCTNLMSIVDTISEMTKYQQRNSGHPVIVHCSDTVGRSGMFCAIATTIERCKTEGVVDVFQVVKALRVQKPGAVLNAVQYKTVFEVALAYLNSFSNYSNF